MADEPIVPVVETPPPEPVDAVDGQGVPWKNRVAEWERKATEATQLNEQYKVALGQLAQQRQTAPAAPAQVTDDLDELGKQFDEPTRKFVTGMIQREARKIAEETGYKFVSQAGVQNELQADPEIAQEARQQYAALNTNPIWRNIPDEARQEHAVAMAGKVVNARRVSKGQTTQTEKDRVEAERALAGGANLPGSRGGAPPPSPANKEEYVKKFMADPESREAFRFAYGTKLNPDSPEGQKAFREAAVIAYDEGQGGKFWGGKSKVAIDVLREEGRGQ